MKICPVQHRERTLSDSEVPAVSLQQHVNLYKHISVPSMLGKLIYDSQYMLYFLHLNRKYSVEHKRSLCVLEHHGAIEISFIIIVIIKTAFL